MQMQKKYLKFLVLTLVIIPCALALSACVPTSAAGDTKYNGVYKLQSVKIAEFVYSGHTLGSGVTALAENANGAQIIEKLFCGSNDSLKIDIEGNNIDFGFISDTSGDRLYFRTKYSIASNGDMTLRNYYDESDIACVGKISLVDDAITITVVDVSIVFVK